ncbi:hypothetical protein JVT61DRAFT_5093 [Boletus reticuloceps]|uniref:DUF7137 domain-containing protein n=1 Tax=Boletus reticuloceps TaxID=495285 RepID=A0A8I2YYY7_9AGAM|nr:hypothetical protein JVT61DRAFT_5093 [Boletus reticuloceps]
MASTSTASSASGAATTVSPTSAASAATGTTASTSSQAFGITGGPGFNPNATHTSIAPNGDPGEIVYTQPPLQSTSFYKIAQGEYITFGWNFTNVAVTPTAITVSAACENGNTYPVGPSDGIIAGNAQSVVWYPYGYQSANPSLPLAQAEYTLLVFAQGGPSAIPSPGYLAPNSQLRFALYTPQPYTPLASGWQCAGCGGALEQFKAHPASIALLTTLLVIFLSGFTTLRRVWD